MKNAEILSKSLLEWTTPIAEKAMQGLASNNLAFSFVQQLISPEWVAKSVVNHLGLPYIEQAVSKLPDESIPQFSLDLVSGMIDKRVKDGALDIPAAGIRLSPEAFKNLKLILESNFKQYKESGSIEEQK